MCPAAGQGALAIEIREGDAATLEHLKFLNDPAARAATTCERALLNRLGGGCQVPIGAFAEVITTHVAADAFVRPADLPAHLHLESIVADPDGSKVLRDSRDGDDPVQLGNEAGAALLARGGAEILQAVYSRGLAIPPQP
jgi:hydroxymethylbilane synthase